MAFLSLLGAIRSASYTEYERIKAKFNRDWVKGTLPIVKAVFIINNNHSKVSNFENYKANRQLPYQQTEEYYHGTKLLCNITCNCRISDTSSGRFVTGNTR